MKETASDSQDSDLSKGPMRRQNRRRKTANKDFAGNSRYRTKWKNPAMGYAIAGVLVGGTGL